MSDEEVAAAIFAKYKSHFDGEVQGCCPVIADDIIRQIGGVAVAGEIRLYGGSVRRTHWWVDKDGATLDPMGDELMDPRDYPERVEIHRDQEIFANILPAYEQWRVV